MAFKKEFLFSPIKTNGVNLFDEYIPNMATFVLLASPTPDLFGNYFRL